MFICKNHFGGARYALYNFYSIYVLLSIHHVSYIFLFLIKKNIPPSKYSEVTSWQGYKAGHQHQLSIHGLKFEWRRYSDNSWQFSHDFILSTSPYFNEPFQREWIQYHYNLRHHSCILQSFHLKLDFHPEEVKMCVDSFLERNNVQS